MSEGTKMPYSMAKEHADIIVSQLQPHCYRIEIAGSIRRKRPLIGDIEIVCIPKPYQAGLFEDGLAAVVNQWKKVKGEMEYGMTKYTQRIVTGGIKLDLFFAEPGNWGSQLAIRTGSAEYSHKVLANGWVIRGYNSVGGYLFQDGKKYEVREEKDLFERIGMPYIEPECREV